MTKISEEFKTALEKMFTRFMKISCRGIRTDYYEKRFNALSREVFLDDLPKSVAERLLSYEIAVYEELEEFESEDLQEALETLSAKQLDIIIRYAVDGENEREIAETLGITRQSVNALKKRACRNIEDFLNTSRR